MASGLGYCVTRIPGMQCRYKSKLVATLRWPTRLRGNLEPCRIGRQGNRLISGYDPLRESFSAQSEESGIEPSAIGVSSLRFRHGGYTRQNRPGARLWWGGRAPSHFTATDLSLFAFARLRLEPSLCAPCSTAMRKSVKRGEPQIYPVCVTLWASAGGVVGPRAFAVPVPEAPTENKSAPPRPRRFGRGVGAIFFPQRKRVSREQGRKKAVTRPLTLVCRIDPPRTEHSGAM